MVHALREAHRVLRPQGLLIDLRPAAVHRRVGIVMGGEYRFKWFTRERFDDDAAADNAVAAVISDGLLRPEGRTRFPCYRVMDTLEDFRAWMNDNIRKEKLVDHDWLIRRLEKAIAASGGEARIVISAPLILRTLRK
jgi:hypothetical protein